ncbi:MAG: hypothetical protein Fur0012_13540 [Elusimicrobiota bacterium]
MKKIFTPLFLAILALRPLFLSAEGGNSSVDILKGDISPRAMSMGGAYAAAADDSQGAFYNPAAIGVIANPEAAFSYSGGFDKTQLNHLSFAMPLPYRGFSNLNRGVLGASILSSSLGKFTYRYIAADGSVVSSNMDAEKNMVFSLSYGEKASEGETAIDKHKLFLEHYLGVSVKYVKSTLLEDYSAGTPAFDAGYRMVEPEKGFSFGLSVSNFGGKIKYVKQSYPLPQILRAGIALRSSPIMDQQLLFTTEYDKFIQDGESAAKVGLEYHLQKILNLRVGYAGIQENKGFSLGLGFFLDNVSADFSTSMLSVYSYSAFSLSYRFSGVEIKEVKKKKKQIKVDEEEAPRRKESVKEKPKPKPKTSSDDFLMLY